jgi:hypothetical protein
MYKGLNLEKNGLNPLDYKKIKIKNENSPCNEILNVTTSLTTFFGSTSFMLFFSQILNFFYRGVYIWTM